MPLTEKALISRIRAVSRTGGAVRLGIGDDCAILRISPDHEILVTTDFSLEGVHFRREWHAPEVVGHRCLTRGLSDIAAMGGDPMAAFLSLALPAKLPQRWVDRFLKGFLGLARQFRVHLAGGDTAQSPGGVLADVVVLGAVPRGEAILRSGARPGDLLYVSGQLGAGAYALHRLFAGKRIKQADYPRHFHPIPRLEVGRYLRKHRLATAMIDLSDGLSTDLAHICDESHVGAEIEAEAIPRALMGGRRSEAVPLKDALHGGDDYELLFAASPHTKIPRHITGVRTTPIGRIIRGKGVVLLANGAHSKLKPAGWEHFYKR